MFSLLQTQPCLLCFETEINLLRQGCAWCGAHRRALPDRHETRVTFEKGNKNKVSLDLKEQAREESKACKAFDFHSILMARIILEFLPMKLYLIRELTTETIKLFILSAGFI